MANKVRAGVLVAPGVTEIREFDMPKLGKGAAICKVLKAGICGTDKHSFRGESVQYKGTANEIDLPFPIIQGHELVMEIVQIDEEASRKLSFDGDILHVGDRITICPDVVCGTCWYCKNIPNYPWCEHLQFSYGNMRSCNDGNHLYGGFSQYIYLEPGTYNGNFQISISQKSNIKIIGNSTILDAQGQTQIFKIYQSSNITIQNIIFKTLQVGLEKRTVFRIEVVILKIKESSVRQPDGSLSHLFQITHLPFRFCSPEMPHNRFVNRL